MGGPTSRPLAHSILGGGSSLGSGGGGGVSGLTSGIVGAQSSGGLVGPMGAPLGVVGAAPAESTKYKGEFTSMTRLAAALTAVGDIAYLIGTATRQPIMLCRRMFLGIQGVAWQGLVEPYQSSGGVEFDGVYAWTPLGAAPAPTWGTPGDLTTGGLVPGAGAYILPGFQRFAGRRRSVWCRWRLVSLPAVPATGHQLQGGLLPSGSTTTDAYLGGWAFNTSTYRACGSVNGNPQSPTLAYSGVGVTLTPGDYIETHVDLSKTSSTSGAASYSCNGSQANNSSSAVQSGGTSNLDSDVDTFQLLITQSGGWVARLVQFAVLPVYG